MCALWGVKAVPKKASISGLKNCDLFTCRSAQESKELCINYKKFLKPVLLGKLKKIHSYKTCEMKCQTDRKCTFWNYEKKTKVCTWRGLKSMSMKRKSSGKINCVLSCNSPAKIPEQCTNYKELDDASRKFGSGDSTYYCDNMSSNQKSPDWQGYEYWYRVVGDAGTQLAPITDASLNCNTYFAHGWPADETHPSSPWETMETKTWVAAGNNLWEDMFNITVTNCDGFYVYKFPEPQQCDERYCTQ
eukprot:TRINITY_DN14488_c0_g1_i1.p1 TRINITY_DN14488_c0_g1~~TRINITY_DN14488_c0_g1_i1.p1  ORF type:complete len:261 (+),score=25.05 TRINITY_DN14488_c0_g1_i1:46-783(+)